MGHDYVHLMTTEYRIFYLSSALGSGDCDKKAEIRKELVCQSFHPYQIICILKLILKYLKCIFCIWTLFSCILILFDKKFFHPCLKYILSVVKLYFIKRKTSLINLQCILFKKYD